MIVTQCVPYVLNESVTLNTLQSRDHGLDHWWRVWKNAQFLAAAPDTGDVDMEVVALYALFHDSMRQTDGGDFGHGDRGYKLFERLSLMLDFEQYMSEVQTELLMEACVDHSTGQRSIDPTIAVCWDADRLDLHRKGVWPNPQFLSTAAGINLTLNRVNHLHDPNSGRK